MCVLFYLFSYACRSKLFVPLLFNSHFPSTLLFHRCSFQCEIKLYQTYKQKYSEIGPIKVCSVRPFAANDNHKCKMQNEKFKD